MSEKISYKYLIKTMSAYAFLMFLGIVLQFPNLAGANPSFFIRGSRTNSAASSTPAYLALGNDKGFATSTVTQDWQTGTLQAADSAIFLAQMIASSTGDVSRVVFEVSDDGVDYYPAPAIVATSTYFTWGFSSTTPLGHNLSTTTPFKNTRAFVVDTPSRFIRAILSMESGSSSMWGQFIGKRESN